MPKHAHQTTENRQEPNKKYRRWSQKYFPKLTKGQHRKNNGWFAFQLSIIKVGGFIIVPDMNTIFIKEGGGKWRELKKN